MCRKLIDLFFVAVMLGLVSSAHAALVAHWTFDETSGTVAQDSSANGLDGNLNGGPVWVPGRIDGALQFDGSNDYVQAPYIPFDSRSFTIAMWVNPVLYTDQQIVFSQRQTSATDTDMHFRLGGPNGTAPDPGAVRMGFYSNDLDTAGGIIQDNTWYHITFWYDYQNQDRRIYVNGVQEAQQSGATPYLGTSGNTVIGSWAGSGQWFRGIIDDVRIYDHALSEAEIKDLIPAQLKAYDPDPPDGTTGWTSPLLSWTAGETATWHDVYLGTDPTPPFKARQPLAWAMWFETGGWIANQTYYWRIDEVEADGTTIHTGDVWSFTAAPVTAYDPDPPDGAKYVPTDKQLSWTSGATAITHDVYFGTDETAVTNGTGGTFNGNQDTASYDPGPLAQDTEYYWRIDEVEQNITIKHTGEVWSFTTIGPYAGALGSYYHWSGSSPPPRTAAFSDLVMTRTDPQIDFSWGNGSPTGVNPDLFAARWIADLEAPSSEPYTLWTLTDDGIRVWLDGVLVIDNWTDHGNTWNSGGPIDFVAGQTYRLEMEWYENTGGAVAELHWASPSTAREPIPSGALQLPLKASRPEPDNGATGVTDTPTLRWRAGMDAVQHQVFFGTDENAVASADTTTAGIYRGTQGVENTSYLPSEAPLELEKTYYWKVNEANGVDLWEGSVWSFTVADYLIIDDFEDYNDYCNRVFYTWGDGWGHNGDLACGVPPSSGNGTGSTVGYLQEPYAEQTITHDGSFQSMPLEYLNDGSTGKQLYSETQREFQLPQDFTRKGMKSLTLWYQGVPGYVGSFSYDAVTDVYTMTASGTDIWDVPDFTGAGAGNYHDEFHYAYKQLSGIGSIEVRVLGVANTNGWAKAGVMIRETLDANSVHAMTVITPAQGVSFQRRPVTAQASEHTTLAGFQAPYWVRITRSGNDFTSEHSADGATWETIGTQNIPMASAVYIGLALTSHNAGATCEATFSNVTTTGTVMGQWQSQDIGIASNDAEQLYVALEDSTGTVKDVPHPDPNAVQLGTWQEWNIDLAAFVPVDLTKVKKIYIGVGNRNAPKLGGGGMLYIDDIRLYAPRCFPDLTKPAGDFSDNCIVDYPDLEIMTNNWLVSPYDVTPDGTNLSAGLIGHYKLDGNLNDIVGGNHGTKMGVGPAAYAAGMDGQALDLDGLNDYVDTDVNATDLGIDANLPKSVTAWVYTRGFNGGGIFDMGSNVNGRNFSLRTLATDNVWRAQRWGYPTYDFDFEYDSLNKWVHFALVYGGAAAGDESWAYADGHLIGSQIAAMDTDGAGRTFQIGVWSGNYFDGLIDDVRVYNRALSQAEAASLAGRTAPFTQLMYPLIDPLDPDSDMVDMNDDGMIDLKDCALLFDIWLEEKLWP